MRSTEIWKSWESFVPFEQRSHRFREEMRPLLFRYLGINEHSRVLDAGCGTGVLARYLAQGLSNGHADGFDINEGAIQLGVERLKELGLEDRVSLKVDDGAALSYASDSFDVVTNYTYLGVLSDQEAGLREMIRVCRPGGTVSAVVASNALPNFHWQGNYPIDGMEELQSLSYRENAIFSAFAQRSWHADIGQIGSWDTLNTAKLFAHCGLADVRMHPFSHLICYDDDRLPFERRRALALGELSEDIGWIGDRYWKKKEIYNRHGFGNGDYDRLIALMKRKLAYLEEHFGETEAFEWHAGLNFVVAGVKAG